MAIDEALARSPNLHVPVLRVYRWQPFTISIGHNQSLEELDLLKCRRDGIGVVRRPTGGRAIFHAHEVTYSVMANEQLFGNKNNSIEIYNHISSAIVLGLQKLDLPVELQRMTEPDAAFPHYKNRFACFATSAKYEIHHNGRKVVGSAQRRLGESFLQHGSIILGNQHLNLVDYLRQAENGKAEAARQQLQEKTICIEAILQREVSYEEVVAKLSAGFEEYFQITCLPDQMSSEELASVEIVKSKYYI